MMLPIEMISALAKNHSDFYLLSDCLDGVSRQAQSASAG